MIIKQEVSYNKAMTQNYTDNNQSAAVAATAAVEEQILFLVPLVQMAWAHGAISPRERRVIFDAAREDGIDERDELNDKLGRWLVYQPSGEFFAECLTLIDDRMRAMTVEERRRQRAKIIERCRKVAETAGDKSPLDVNHGVSPEEKRLLDELNEVFK